MKQLARRLVQALCLPLMLLPLLALMPAMSAAAATATAAAALEPPIRLFPLADVRLGESPFLDAQRTDLRYMLEMEPDRLLAPFLREAGLPSKQPGYGNWESSGLDGHLGGHYLSALALMFASTGDAEVLRRLNYFVAELKRCQQQNGNGYLGGIPEGSSAWQGIARGELHADNFSVNGKWVPWYNLHKVYAGLRDAYQYAGNRDARDMLIALSDWALELTSHLSEAQMQAMLRSEHGGMNEVLADVAQITGERKYSIWQCGFRSRHWCSRWLRGATSSLVCMPTRRFPRSSASSASAK